MMNSSTGCMVWIWVGCLIKSLRHLLLLPLCLPRPWLPRRQDQAAALHPQDRRGRTKTSSTGCMVWSWEGCLTQSLRHLLLLPRCLRPPRLPQRQQQPLALNLPVLEKMSMIKSSTGCMVWSLEGCLIQCLRHLLPPPHCLHPPRLLQRHLRLPAMHLLLSGMRAMMNSSTVCMVWSWEGCLTQSLRHLRPPPRCLRPPRLP